MKTTEICARRKSSLPNLSKFRITVAGRNGFAPNPDYPAFLQEVNKHFIETGSSREYDYVGLSGYGSQFTGFVNRGSDFDILLIAGNSTCKMENRLCEVVKSIGRKKFGINGSIPHIVSKDYFESNFDQQPESRAAYGHAAWRLAYPLIGDQAKISRLRELLKWRHRSRKKVSSLHAESNLMNAVFYLLHFELGVTVNFEGKRVTSSFFKFPSTTMEKILSRGCSRLEFHDVVQQRYQFWLHQMRKLFGD